MASVEPLIRDLVVHCPTVNDLLARSAISESARRFCRESWAWRECDSLEAKFLFEGQWELEVPDEAEVYTATSVFCDDEEYHAATPAQIKRWAGKSCVPGARKRFAYCDESLSFSPPPTSGILTCETVLIPVPDSDELPDLLLRDYDSVILDGALSWVFSIPDRAWSNFTRAREFAARARNAAVLARSRSDAHRTANVERTMSYGGI